MTCASIASELRALALLATLAFLGACGPDDGPSPLEDCIEDCKLEQQLPEPACLAQCTSTGAE